jgi:hypothetical protein
MLRIRAIFLNVNGVAGVIRSSGTLTLIMEAVRSSETLSYSRNIKRLNNGRRNPKSHITELEKLQNIVRSNLHRYLKFATIEVDRS